jgi:hypothetical protein
MSPAHNSARKHTPASDPAVSAHDKPAQQSAGTVQEFPDETQLSALQRSLPEASAVQGTAPQQSTFDAQAPPTSTHASPRAVQRGMPSASSSQVPVEVPSQQRLDAELMEQA